MEGNVSIGAPLTLDNHLEYYMISEDTKEYQFDEFLANPSFCAEFTYELLIEDPQAELIVKAFAAQDRTIVLEYFDDLKPLDDDLELPFKDF